MGRLQFPFYFTQHTDESMSCNLVKWPGHKYHQVPIQTSMKASPPTSTFSLFIGEIWNTKNRESLLAAFYKLRNRNGLSSKSIGLPRNKLRTVYCHHSLTPIFNSHSTLWRTLPSIEDDINNWYEVSSHDYIAWSIMDLNFSGISPTVSEGEGPLPTTSQGWHD